MASEAQIGKLALQHIGDRWDIASLEELTAEAENVEVLFDDLRDATLRSHPWGFARKYRDQATLDITVPGNWTYAYAYPSDCVRMLGIVNPEGDDKPPIRFEVANVEISGNDTKVILTDQDDAELVYTLRVTDPTKFDPEFTMAFSFTLAAAMAMSITGDQSIRQDLEREAFRWRAHAEESDSAEQIAADIPDADWIRARQ